MVLSNLYIWGMSNFQPFFLKKLGLSHIHTNYSIFISTINLKSLILNLFINDIKIMGMEKSGIITKIKAKLITSFWIVDMEPINFYLRLKVKRNPEKKTIKLS